jgi:hypothetical protein
MLLVSLTDLLSHYCAFRWHHSEPVQVDRHLVIGHVLTSQPIPASANKIHR